MSEQQVNFIDTSKPPPQNFVHRFYPQHTSRKFDVSSAGPTMTGTVVGEGTSGGALYDYDAHKPGKVTVMNVDDPNDTVVVDLSKVTKEDTVLVTENGKLLKQARSNEQERDLAVEGYRRLAEIQNKIVPTASTITTPSQNNLNGAQATFQPANKYAATEAFNRQPHKKEEVMQANQTTAPTKKVTFELEGFGSLTTFYHFADRQENCLILAFDNNYLGSAKYNPPTLLEEEKFILVDVNDLPEFYKVRSVGIQFTLLNYEVCVLLIDESRPKE